MKKIKVYSGDLLRGIVFYDGSGQEVGTVGLVKDHCNIVELEDNENNLIEKVSEESK